MTTRAPFDVFTSCGLESASDVILLAVVSMVPALVIGFVVGLTL